MTQTGGGRPRRPGAPAALRHTGERPWVGRSAEAQLIAELLSALDDDEGSVLEVAGEPGIGKSRLLQELCAKAAERGHLVLSGRAAEFEAELPFGVFGDAMEDWLRAQGRDGLEALAEEVAAHLAAVFPAFERVAPESPPELQQERYRSYRAVRNLLSAMAADGPVVLALDDIQWADPASIELLCHLLTHPPPGAVLLALGLRAAQVPPRVKTALAAAERNHHARRLHLRPLDGPAARKLLTPDIADSVFERLYTESGGNPFFLLQLARRVEMSSAGMVSSTASVPEPVRAALATELSSLSKRSLQLLQGAAVTGDPFDARLAATVAEIADLDALDLFDELLRFELVFPTAVAGQLGFRHPIVRATVYELTTSGWRAQAHGRRARLLADRGASTSAQAAHLERSASVGDARAISILVEAGRVDAPRAPALAARWYGAALSLLPEGAQTEAKRVELMIASATALGGAGHLNASQGALSELLERLPPEHPAWISVVAYCAGVEHLLGRHRAADARLRRALAVVTDMASVEAVRLMVELAAGAGYENRYEDMLRCAHDAFEGATRLGERALAVAAAGQVALAQYFLGLPAGEAMDRAAAAADALEDAELARRLDIGLWVGWTEAVLERHDRAIAHCQRVIDVSRASGQGAVLLVTMTAKAWSLIRLGRLAEAEELLTGAIEAGYLAPNLFLSVAVGLSSVVATCQGRFDAALRAGEESVRLARSADPGLIPGMSGLYNAVPLIELGRASRAKEILLAMSGGGPDLQTSRSGYAAAYEVLTRADLALQNIESAEEWARRAEKAAGAGELPAESAHAWRATAAVALARGEAERATELALEAATRAEAARAPIEAGRCRIVGARALAQAGHQHQAVAELERAVETLERIGAKGYCAEAQKELRALGRRVRRGTAGAAAADEAMRRLDPSQAGLTILSRSERAVVALVADGLTNPEVADKLYLSRHTVKRHLANAMRKLDVHSRRELRPFSRRTTGESA